MRCAAAGATGLCHHSFPSWERRRPAGLPHGNEPFFPPTSRRRSQGRNPVQSEKRSWWRWQWRVAQMERNAGVPPAATRIAGWANDIPRVLDCRTCRGSDSRALISWRPAQWRDAPQGCFIPGGKVEKAELSKKFALEMLERQ